MKSGSSVASAGRISSSRASKSDFSERVDLQAQKHTVPAFYERKAAREETTSGAGILLHFRKQQLPNQFLAPMGLARRLERWAREGTAFLEKDANLYKIH